MTHSRLSRSITSLIHDGGGGDGGDDVHENEEELQSIGERIRIRYCSSLRYNSPAVPTKLEIWHFEMKSGGPEKKPKKHTYIQRKSYI